MEGVGIVDCYGKELIIDLHDCNPGTFTRRKIKNYFKLLCEIIDMEREELYWWDDLHTPEGEKETKAHLVGTSAVQFIKTSNITIHTLDLLKRVYLNVFSCKDFDEDAVINFSATYFEGKIVKQTVVRRT